MDLDKIVRRSRKLFRQVVGLPFSYIPSPGDLGGLCGVSQSCIYYSMLELGIDRNSIKLLQLCPFISKYSHCCVGYYVGEEVYILDLTFSQFLKEWDIIGMYFVRDGYIRACRSTIRWLYNKLNDDTRPVLAPKGGSSSPFGRGGSAPEFARGAVEQSDTRRDDLGGEYDLNSIIKIILDPPSGMICEVDHDKEELKN